MARPIATVVMLRPASAARYDSLEIPGLLKHGRVSLMRELFQCGKPLPIEEICTDEETVLAPVKPPSTNVKSRAPSFLADLKGESAVQRRLRNAINECNGEADDDDNTPDVKDLARNLVNQLSGDSWDREPKSNGAAGMEEPLCAAPKQTPPPIPARPSTLPPYLRALQSSSSSSSSSSDSVQTQPLNGRAEPSPSTSTPQKGSAGAESQVGRGICLKYDPLTTHSPSSSSSSSSSSSYGDLQTLMEAPADEVLDTEDYSDEDTTSAEDTGDWDPIDSMAENEKVAEFALPSHLRPVAVAVKVWDSDVGKTSFRVNWELDKDPGSDDVVALASGFSEESGWNCSGKGKKSSCLFKGLQENEQYLGLVYVLHKYSNGTVHFGNASRYFLVNTDFTTRSGVLAFGVLTSLLLHAFY